MSPHFCYRFQPSRGDGIQPLSDNALASRLSFFLWSSIPDESLLQKAAAGNLHKPEVLLTETRRMLKDDRIRGLATEFGGNWLDFRRFEEHNSVDRERFNTFNNALREAMYQEPIEFFLYVLRANRPVLDFLYADYTLVNPILARHYGMPGPGTNGDSNGWVVIEDAQKYARGGLYTHVRVPDEKFAMTPYESSEARLLGCATLARRDNSPTATDRPGIAQR
jgi:hypothetical protein